MMSSLSFLRVWEMPNKYTFRMKSVGELLKGEMVGVWADPFSGLHSPASIRNDADEANPAEHHMDGLDFLKTLADSSVDGVSRVPPELTTRISGAFLLAIAFALGTVVYLLAAWEMSK